MKIIKIFLITLLCLLSAAPFSYAEKVSVKELLDSPAKFNRRYVEIEGEVIGEALNAEEGFWLNLVSQGCNIAIFVPKEELMEDLKYWGSYKEQGDYVRIKGIFYKDCPQHQERDVHAEKIEVIKQGFVKKEELAPYKVRLSIYLFIICLTLMLIYFIKEYIKRRK